MRVGIMTDSVECGPSSVGNYTKNMVENLLEIANGVEFHLIHCQKGSDPLYEKAEEVVLPFLRSSSRILPVRIFSFLNRQTKIRKSLSTFDIIHVPHLAGVTAPPWGVLAVNSLLVVTLHGVAPLVVPSPEYYEGRSLLLRTHILREFSRWKLFFKNKITAVITVSESEKINISEKLSIPQESIRAIYHGVSEHFRLLPKKEVRKSLEKYDIDYPFVFHVSAYQPKKNVIRLIEAFKNVKTDHKLVISGNQGEIIKMVTKKLNLQDRVFFTGFIDEADLVALYNAADVFVFPSLHESFGMPLLEAMACGCPVITSRVFSMPEIAGDAAVLVNPYNVCEITTAMQRVLTNAEMRETLKKKGLKRVKQFSWRKCAEEHMKVYEDVYDERRS